MISAAAAICLRLRRRRIVAVSPVRDRLSFIGGILRHGRALCAAFAPTVNSYKRLVRQGAMATFSWAPVFNSYGSNNRTNSVRVPAAGGRCESRNADGAVNPYLAAALALAAGLEGIREKIDPATPTRTTCIRSPKRHGAGAISTSCRKLCKRAVAAFADDPLMEATLERSCAMSSSIQDGGMGGLPPHRQSMGDRALQPYVLTSSARGGDHACASQPAGQPDQHIAARGSAERSRPHGGSAWL